MIYIISNTFDPTTNAIIDWLNFYKKKYTRINDYVAESYKIPFKINLNKNNLLKDVLWIRKPAFKNEGNYMIHIHNEVNRGLYEIAEWRFKKVIGSFNRIYSLNKIKVLKLAQSQGLLIPPTIVTTQKQDLQEFINENKCVITKCCSDMMPLTIENDKYYQYTSIVDDETLSEIPESFTISLFQKHIKKAFDIKIVYVNGDFYGQAIFSQSSEQTSIDFRNYNYSKPNRTCPFKLPKNTEIQLKKLIESLEEEICTIDFIMSEDNKLYFLEINPNGEFLGISKRCNYHLDKKIAEFLIQ